MLRSAGSACAVLQCTRVKAYQSICFEVLKHAAGSHCRPLEFGPFSGTLSTPNIDCSTVLYSSDSKCTSSNGSFASCSRAVAVSGVERG
eukprot:1435-Heterococcus_DN1.PRE.3